ncbi:MAG: hypothetical protein ACK47M_01010 [Caldilinea sp.]
MGEPVAQNISQGVAPTLVTERTFSQRVVSGWRQASAQPKTADVMASSLFSAQIWAEASFWRPAALWAGVAGVLSVGATASTVDWRTLSLALLLVDVLWGSVWRLAGGRTQSLALPPGSLRRRVWLPYLQPDSPAARIFSGDHRDIWPLAFRTGLPAMVLALLAAAALGIEAFLLTVAVVIIAVAGWTARHALGGIPMILSGVVSIGLPWLLLMRQMAPAGVEIEWLAPIVLLSCWVLHYWGEMLILADSRAVQAMTLLGIAEIGIIVLLIIVQAPLWLAGVVLLFLPTWLMIAQGGQVGRRMQPLWLLALLLSALALGQVI